MDDNDQKANLHNSLQRLHSELEQAQGSGLDDESRRLLTHLSSDIQVMLGGGQPPGRASLRARLYSVIDRMEDTHPDLTLTIKNVLDNLAQV